MVSSAGPPIVSVIIATYNWSSALKFAIGSALLQTFSNFELLVVGDGCTDDSEQVALGFGDSRIRWVNLTSNTGGQALPNNYGISLAQGEYIAYLGHDDLWYPTHLASLLETMERTQADMAGAVAILYGPRTSGVTSVTGVFPGPEYPRRGMMVPSSILHRKSLALKIRGWKKPWEISLPADVDFEKRAFNAGAKIVSSNELTVFKFNAAWRRNSYLTRSTVEQEEMLGRIRRGIDFRQQELLAVVRSVVGGRFVLIEAPSPWQPGEIARWNARYKGTAREGEPPRIIEALTRFTLEDQLAGFEWYGMEHNSEWGTLRWSGPSRTSNLEFPVGWDRSIEIRVKIVSHFQQDLARDVKLSVSGERIETALASCDDGAFVLSGTVPGGNPGPLRLTIEVARTAQPSDLGINEDRRWLGIAVNWVELAPQ